MSGSVEADPRIGSEIAGYRIETLVGRAGGFHFGERAPEAVSALGGAARRQPNTGGGGSDTESS